MSYQAQTQIRLSSAQVNRAAQKAESDHLKHKKLAEQAMRSKNVALARTHAEAAVRAKETATRYRRLAAQQTGAADIVKEAEVTADVVRSTQVANEAIAAAMADGASPEAAIATFDELGRNTEALAMQASLQDHALDSAGSLSAPAPEVDDLLGRLAAEHAIDVAGMLPSAPSQLPAAPQASQQRAQQPAQPQQRPHNPYGGY